ncbi:uncharacterized protein LOC135476994 [Liolophura sinensis]|uniref:uncharacterized protein LOC135476994 n=1 Tax=Liolophura sinensis TaxID=3198878 RepID=UPI00315880F2
MCMFVSAGPSNVLPNWFNPRKDVNGCGVWLPATEASPCGYNWIFPDITQADINVLRDIGANVHLKDLDRVIDVVNNHWALTYYGFLPCSRHACGKGCCLGFLIFAVFQLIIAGISMHFRLLLSVQAVIGYFCMFVIIPIVVVSCWRSKHVAIRKAERKLSRVLLEKNRILYRKCKVIVSVRVDPTPKIAVVYYNTQRCKDFIKELLKNNRGGERMDQVNDEELDARADAIVDNLVDKLASKFARWEEIQAANFLRHKTKQDKLCLCQLYEASSEHSF